MEQTNRSLSRRTFVGVAATALAGLALGGCAASPEEPAALDESPNEREPAAKAPAVDAVPQEAEPGAAAAGSNAVIAVFSRTGNTLALAEAVKARTGLDLARIEPATPYPDDYDEMLDLGQREQDEDARPALAADVPSLAGYDTVCTCGLSRLVGPYPADREDAGQPRRPGGRDHRAVLHVRLQRHHRVGSRPAGALPGRHRARRPDGHRRRVSPRWIPLLRSWLAGLGL